MKTRFTASLLVSTAMLCSQGNATDYYACSTGGSDSNDGLSTGAPFLTYSKIRETIAGFSAGDNLYLCKDGVFEQVDGDEERITQTGCTEAGPCTVGVYGAGAKAKIYSSPTEALALFQINGVGHTEPNKEQWITFTGLHFIGRGRTHRGFYMDNGIKHVTFDDVKFENFKLGVHTVDFAKSADYIKFINVEFTKMHASAVLGGNGSNFTFENIIIDRAGYYTPILDHGAYFSDLTDSRIYNVSFTRTAHSLDTGVTITAATQTNPVQVTAAGHGYTNGQEVFLKEVGGMDMISNSWFTVSNATTDTFTIGVDGTGPLYTAFTSGGASHADLKTCSAGVLIGHGINDSVQIEKISIFEEPDTALATCWGIVMDSGGYSGVDEQNTRITVAESEIHNVGNVYVGFSNVGNSFAQLNKFYHDNNKSQFQGVVADTKGGDPYVSNNLTSQYNTMIVVDSAGSDIGVKVPAVTSATSNNDHIKR